MRVVGVLAVLALLAGCSGGGSGGAAPTVPAGSADASGWSKDSVAAVRAVGEKIAKGLPGECKDFHVAARATYITGARKIGKPYPDAVGDCTTLTEDLEMSAFASSAARDDFINTRREKICAISARTKVGLPGLYWVVGGDWSVQPDSEGVARRVAHALNAQYKATGCTDKNPGWDPAAVAAIEQTASKLETNHEGCADVEMQDRDLVSHTPPYTRIGTPAAAANCSLRGGASIVLAAYNTPAEKTETLLRGEMSRECAGSSTVRIVRTGNLALFASTPAVADKIKNAVGGSLSPIVCQNLK